MISVKPPLTGRPTGIGRASLVGYGAEDHCLPIRHQCRPLPHLGIPGWGQPGGTHIRGGARRLDADYQSFISGWLTWTREQPHQTDQLRTSM
jgi:hypothetical protein